MEPSFLNFAVTDGVSVVCSRYVNSTEVDAASLYISSGSKFECYEPGHYRMIKTAAKRVDLVVIASEPLTFEEADWLKVPTNTLLVVTSRMNVLMYPIEDEYQRPHKTNGWVALSETETDTETEIARAIAMEAEGRRRRQHHHQQDVLPSVESKPPLLPPPPVSIVTSPIAIAGRGDSKGDNRSRSSSSVHTPSTPGMSSWVSSHYLPSSPSDSSMSTASSVLSDRAIGEYLQAERLVNGGHLDGQGYKNGGCQGGDDDDDDDNEIEEDYRIFPVKRSLASSVHPQGR
jgi:hypothetical protein